MMAIAPITEAALRLVAAVETHAASGGWARVNWATEQAEREVMAAADAVKAAVGNGRSEP